MILSKFKDQLILIPTFGIVKDNYCIRFVLSFLCYAISITLLVVDKDSVEVDNTVQEQNNSEE